MRRAHAQGEALREGAQRQRMHDAALASRNFTGERDAYVVFRLYDGGRHLTRRRSLTIAGLLATGLMAATWFFVQAQQPAQADINDDPFRGGATVSTEGQRQEEFRQLIRSEARQLSYWLAVASGAGVECDDTCERVDDPVRLSAGDLAAREKRSRIEVALQTDIRQGVARPRQCDGRVEAQPVDRDRGCEIAIASAGTAGRCTRRSSGI